MRSSFNHPDPSEYQTPIVDSRIGNAYKTVKYVHDNFDKLMAVVPKSVQQDVLEGFTGLAGETVELGLPEGVSVTDLINSEVTLRDHNFKFHPQESPVWIVELLGGILSVTVPVGSPTAVQNAKFFWNISYRKGS